MTESASLSLFVVSDELNTTLRKAQIALEDAIERNGARDSLLQCAEQLHEMRGVLQMVEVYGAALLAEEMEAVTHYLAGFRPGTRGQEDGLDALARSIVQLPAYLQRILAGGRDIPLVLLPLLNDLRAVRGRPLLSESTLLLLNGSSGNGGKQPELRPSGEDLAELLSRLRPAFQLALLGWIKGQQSKEHLAKLARVAESIEKAAPNRSIHQLWWVVGAILEALRDGGLEASVAIKRLLGQADREMRRVADIGADAYDAKPPTDLLNNLLYYVARANSDQGRIADVRRAFNLTDKLPGDKQVEDARAGLSAPSPELMKTVAGVMKDDLAHVKDVLDIYVRTGGENDADLLPQLAMLKKISDTLGVLGLGNLRGDIQGEVDRLGALVEDRSKLDDAALMQVAATLLTVEDSLDQQLQNLVRPDTDDEPGEASDAMPPLDSREQVDYQQVTHAVVRECLINLARLKEGITRIAANSNDRLGIDNADSLMHGVKAGLLMLGKQRAMDVAERLLVFIDRALRRAREPLGPENLDRLADAMVSLEYYLETVQAGRRDPWYMLDNAEGCLDLLEALDLNAIGEGGGTQELASSEIDAALGRNSDDASERGSTEVLGAPERTEVVALPVVSEQLDHVDPELLELFIEESREEVESIEKHLPRWLDEPEDHESLITLRRSFHTLKGSGRMVGAERIGEYCWSIEDLLNRLINQTLSRTPPMLDFLRDAAAVVPDLIEQIEVGTEPSQDIAFLMLKANAFAEGDPDAATMMAAGDTSDEQSLEMDPVLLEIFSKETAGHVATLGEFASACADGQAPYAISEELYRACHTLHGSVTMANLDRALPLTGALNRMVRRFADSDRGLDDHALGLLARSRLAIEALVETINKSHTASDYSELIEAMNRITDAVTLAGDSIIEQELELATIEADANVAPIAADADVDAEYDHEIAAIFTEEAAELLEATDEALHSYTADPQRAEPLRELKRHLHTLKGGARMAGIQAMGDVAHELEAALIALEEERLEPAPATLSLLQTSVDEMHRMRETVAGGQRLVMPTDLLGDLHKLLGRELLAPESPEFDDAPGVDGSSTIVEMLEIDEDIEILNEPIVDDQLDESGTSSEFIEEIQSDDVEEDAAALTLTGDDDTWIGTVLDPEVLAGEDAAVISSDDIGERPADDASFEHTSVFGVGSDGSSEPAIPAANTEELSAEDNLESASGASLEHSDLEEAAEQLDDQDGNTESLVDDAFDPEPTIVSATDVFRSPTGAADLDALMDAGRDSLITQGPAIADESDGEFDSVDADSRDYESLDLPVELSGDLPVVPPGLAVPVVDAPTAERQEFARVDAELLEDLLNAAGEISIFHSRLTQQVSLVDFNLTELEQTVSRLRGQLRKLEIETEAQILHRHQEDERDPGFDPLEMDRYSLIQQLSRALAESANDVGSIKDLLQSLTGDAETLLVQQARVTAELQDGLMRTRMVPFSRHLSRLSRVVRQSAAETGRQVELEIEGAGGELDRQVLEKMLPPFEHMLRNAVIHGIEDEAGRRAANKPAGGRISVRLHREGSEMVIDVSDDGRGLDVNAIRAKAFEQGLISADAETTNDEVMELILEPGFSTAGTLTQSAGRGVGMDVVSSEIKKLGGSLQISSIQGQGTNFTIRLPFTLAITQALIVRAADEVYALPLPSVEGVARVQRKQLDTLLASEDRLFDYGERAYRIYHLGQAIGGPPTVLPEDDSPVPLILVRKGDTAIALLTDEMMTSREIVVKSVGPQLAGVRGIAGATILGDGRVVLILDPSELISGRGPVVDATEVDSRPVVIDKRPLVMVVDDSITVRRVTERFLNRHDMRSVTARDGIDAIARLEDEAPDIILLDIEMPRMDGYEFASHVRNDARFADTPIVMITSRVSEKHKARAIEIGVNDYLGKPYQDHQLLDTIRRYLPESDGGEDD